MIITCFNEIGSIYSQTVDENFWSPNGPVYTIVQSQNTIYIGGRFTYIGPPTGSGALLEINNVSPNLEFARINGSVFAVAADGSGGWYVGGSFTKVGGVTRNNIAHINSDGSLNENWNPNINGLVNTLSLSGSVIYIGGEFTNVGGITKNHIAGINASTGAPTNWNPNANSTVLGIAVMDSIIYACGYFDTLGGQNRNYIAAIDASTGNPTNWDLNSDDFVSSVAVSDSVIYLGGAFTIIGGQNRNYLAAVHAFTGNATNWNPNPNGRVRALLISDSNVYVGGEFTKIGGEERNHIAAFNSSTGLTTNWNPNANNIVEVILRFDSTILLGGQFSSIGGQIRNYIAAIDITGNILQWNPNFNAPVSAIALYNSTVYVGGQFTSVGGEWRNNIAAIDAITGVATNWNPDITGDFFPTPPYVYVLELSLSGSIIYVGGDFTSVGEQERNNIAAIDAITGKATNWNPNANGEVWALAISPSDSIIYTGGRFSRIGAIFPWDIRNGIAAINTSTGLATNWNPNANGDVLTVCLLDSLVYAGGRFTNIGGQDRNYIAALDSINGNATSWNPSADDWVHTLAISNTTIFAGGWFTSIGGIIRNHIAAIDPTTGLPTNWDPSFNENSLVRSLVVSPSGSIIYAGGNFNQIGDQIRNNIAAIDAITGDVTNWNPNANGEVWSFSIQDPNIYIGGFFQELSSYWRPYFAAFTKEIPVELISFSATIKDKDIELRWETASETNNKGFELQKRKVDEGNWQAISFISGMSTTTKPQIYTYTDKNVSDGKYLYRLKQIDFDGSFEYSNLVEINLNIPFHFNLEQNFPNPFNVSTTINYFIAEPSQVTLKIFNSLGEEISLLINETQSAGKYIYRFQGQDLSSGVYFYQLSTLNVSTKYKSIKKFVLLK